MRRYGGLTLDDAGPTLAPTVFAIAESPRQPGEIWAGTNDGRLQLSRDGGATWSDLTKRLPDVPTLGTISNIEPSRHQDGVAYITIDAHQEGDFAPYVLKTENHGRSWRRLDDDLPRPVAGWAHCVREDPVRPGLLYLGTENALYVSFDDGAAWHRLQAGLPTAPVHWLEIQPHFHDLVVATYGRGFFVLDDITPLRQADDALLERSAALLAPRFAYRFRMKEAPMMQPRDPAAGTNPEYGAALHIWLRDDVDEEAELALTIRDADGTVVRTLDELPRGAGLHRVMWNLRGETTPEIKLRTPPDENPHIGLGEDGWRRLGDAHRFSLLVPPGRYTVTLSVGDETSEQRLEVRKDPNSAGSEADIRGQHALLERLREAVVSVADAVNEIEWVRRQLDELEARLAAHSDAEAVADALERATTLDTRLREAEGTFFDLRLTGAGQDSLRWKRLLASRLVYLGFAVGQSDFPPTASQIAVAEKLLADTAAAIDAFTPLRADIAGFNETLRAAGLDGVLVGLGQED